MPLKSLQVDPSCPKVQVDTTNQAFTWPSDHACTAFMKVTSSTNPVLFMAITLQTAACQGGMVADLQTAMILLKVPKLAPSSSR